jgi:hypothetical protein
MRPWEYYIAAFNQGWKTGDKKMENMSYLDGLNYIGSFGWELVDRSFGAGSYMDFLFKRPKPDGVTSSRAE